MMPLIHGETFLISDNFKVVVDDWCLSTVILLINKNNNLAYLDIDKWTEFRKSLTAIDDELNKRLNVDYPRSDIFQAKEFIITKDFKITANSWKSTTALLITNSDGNAKHFVIISINEWNELKKRVNEIDVEFRKRFNYQYSNY